MAKTRMLKHELRTSVKVASWPIEVRYFWTLLWGYVDDHGKARDNPLLVKADCFPLDEQITGSVVDGWLWFLAGEGVIVRFEAKDQQWLQVINWKEHQKPPHPTADLLPNHSDGAPRNPPANFMHDAGTTHAALTPVLGSDWVVIEGGAKSPFCSKHPNGTPDSCRACGNARRAYDARALTEKNKPTPAPPKGKPNAATCRHKYVAGWCVSGCEQKEP